jgi:predicted regulator of Ras-like GTPase activity (Roadblock/LC7/MglB family)
MSFEQELEAICNEVPGAQTAWVMSLDGISVANHDAKTNKLDAEILLIEMIGSLKQAFGALSSVSAGELNAMELVFGNGSLLVSLLNEEHFVALLLAPEALIGKGRYAIRRHTLALRKEFY